MGLEGIPNFSEMILLSTLVSLINLMKQSFGISFKQVYSGSIG